MTVLSPFVYWAQSEESLFVKVDLKNATDTDVNFNKRRLEFKAKGQGARGVNDYKFALDFYEDINAKESSFKVLDNNVNVQILKENKGWWPRLISQPQKPAWLKIDFDKWQSEEDIDDEEDEKLRDIREDYKDLYDKLQKEELGYSKEEFRKVYLGFYNLFMFVGFLYILSVLGIKFFRDGVDAFPTIYEAVGSILVLLIISQFLEVLHCILGYTSGSWIVALVQAGGRGIILLLVIDSEPRIQTSPAIFYLFLIWSAIEVIRYPYYITQVYNKTNKLLTWLRYTAWIPLYPLGIFCENFILFKSIPYFEETQQFSVSLPNKVNFSFYFPTLIRIYLLLFSFPTAYMLMTHMYRARRKKLGPKKWGKSS